MPENKSDNVFLVGPMGSGKTTIGRQIARALKKKFIDSDHEIEKRTGVDIPFIFDKEGEDGFRKREHDMIEELAAHKDIVLATGGGSVIWPANRQLLKQNGVVIYLHAELKELLKRTARDRNRPLLQTDDPKSKLAKLIQEREDFYREVADFVIDTGGRTAKSVVKEILEKIAPEKIPPE